MRPVDRDLAELRLEAEQALRDDEWQRLIALKVRLREQDPGYWPHLWAPSIAIGVTKTGGDGWPDLVAAVDAGFRQPELLPLTDAFHTHAGWAELLDRMHEPAPPDRWTLATWPTIDYGPLLVLDTIAPARAERLRNALLPAKASAWETAIQLLEWTTTHWDHANDHVDGGDAVDVLDGVATGRRFACVEYSIVLSQSLNAIGIPARRLNLRGRDSHVGFGRGHVVSEAWIDDLGKWVVLDGQNGAWWGTQSEPLGYTELHAAFASGLDRPAMVSTARDNTAQDQDEWWRYFDSTISSGMSWSQPYVATFQGETAPARLLVAPDANVYPDLSQLATTIVDLPDGPGVAFSPIHPYAKGIRLGNSDVSIGEAVALARVFATSMSAEVAALTPYGPLQPHELTLIASD